MNYTLFFNKSKPEDFQYLGGKGASLASMSIAEMPVPVGFCITTHSYEHFLVDSGLKPEILRLIGSIDFNDITTLDRISAEIRAVIMNVSIPDEVQNHIKESYAELCTMCNLPDALPVAVRSSATAEDLPDASFAGQQDTYLWIVGENEVLENVRKCWASLFTSRAINYRKDQNISEDELSMCVVIQKMVNARTAGVAMTLNPINGDRSKIVIDSSWGLGEAVVSGEVTPDNFMVDKIMLEVIHSNIQNKHIEHVADQENRCVVIREINDERASQPSISETELKELCRIVKSIEKYYRCPLDIEWAIDADLAEGHNFTLLQSRPETVWSQKKAESGTVKLGMEGILNTLMNPIGSKSN
jgi:pyruvate,water dikinase